MWARGRCRISPLRFLAECCERQLNQVSFVLLLSTFSDLYWVFLFVFSCTVLFVSISQVIGCEDRLRNDLYCVKWALNSTLTPTPTLFFTALIFCYHTVSYRTMSISAYVVVGADSLDHRTFAVDCLASQNRRSGCPSITSTVDSRKGLMLSQAVKSVDRKHSLCLAFYGKYWNVGEWIMYESCMKLVHWDTVLLTRGRIAAAPCE